MPSRDPHSLIAAFDRLIRRDPAHRGLISTEAQFGPLCPGHLLGAAEELAARAERVALVTGFFIPHCEPPCAETDGPPGTALLAAALQALGIETLIVTDEPCRRAVATAAAAMGLPGGRVIVPAASSLEVLQADALQAIGGPVTHLVAIERVGPSHTEDSFHRQRREGSHPLDRFRADVPEDSWGRCHNMRGRVIDEYTGDLYRLFDEAAADGRVRTIGIGDGGNEIGMGAIAWEELRRRLAGDHSARIPCRIATDWTILAGTSNWGAAALAASVAVLRGRADVLRPWDRDQQLGVLQRLVDEGPAVDGITGLREPTVDGLPFLTYIQPWEGIRHLLGYN